VKAIRGDQNPQIAPGDVAYWHIASFRCDTEFGRYRGIADTDQVETDQTRFMSARP
jgi:hypothetical protein